MPIRTSKCRIPIFHFSFRPSVGPSVYLHISPKEERAEGEREGEEMVSKGKETGQGLPSAQSTWMDKTDKMEHRED